MGAPVRAADAFFGHLDTIAWTRLALAAPWKRERRVEPETRAEGPA